MAEGLSGTYAFNNVAWTLQPTTGKWVERTNYGMDGSAHPIYSQFRSFEATFELSSTEDAKQFIDFYNTVSVTGSLTVCLPQWGSIDYRFKNYSGSTMMEPTVDAYFQGYIQSVRLLLVNINTNQ